MVTTGLEDLEMSGEFETYPGSFRDFVNSQGIVWEKNLAMEKCPITVDY